MANAEAGAKLWETDAANPVFANCVIAGNGGAGIEMWSASGGRLRKYNCATVLHSTIVGNANEGIWGGDPIVVNSIVHANGRSGVPQIDAHDATVSGCNIEGDCPGAGNIDAEPGFTTPGFWASADETNPDAFAEEKEITGVAEPIFGWLATDIDGDPRIVGRRPDIGCDEFAPARQ